MNETNDERSKGEGGRLKAPFPYFGGKSAVADLIWQRFGDAPNYVDPFAGSLAVLLARPTEPGIETANDLDGSISNFWRSVKTSPDEVAHHADWPVNECDLTARHLWLVRRKPELTERLMADPEWCDPKAAGWWVWGICSWIGNGWCSGMGPWTEVDGTLVKAGNSGQGINRQRPHLGNAGQGINRKRPHLGNAGQGVNRQRPHLGNAGRGVNRKSDAGTCAEWSAHLRGMMRALSDRLRRVRVCCGDWSRVLGPSPTTKLGVTAVFLDPPYSAEAGRDNDLYAEESLTVAHDVRAWAIEHGDDPLLRIALCGYAGEHTMPDSWECIEWKTRGGYGNAGNGAGKENADRERIWVSQHCIRPASQVQATLFDE